MAEDVSGAPSGVPGDSPGCRSFLAGNEDVAAAQFATVAAGLAHNLNNRLEIVIGGIALASEDAPEPARRVLLEALLAAEEMAEAVRQLVAFSGRGRFVPVTADFPQMTRSALGRCHIPRNIRLEMYLPDAIAPVVADVEAFERAVRNLVANAVEAIGADPGTIRIRASEDLLDGRHCVCLSVEDTGAGFDPAHLDRLFDPFFSTRAPGRGLGLAAVLGIARRHKGAVRAALLPAGGCRFSFYLPAKS